MLKKTITILCAGFLVAGISACEKEEGPLEKAGKSLDQATESVGEKYEETKDAVLDNGVAEKIGEGIDKAGESIDNAAESIADTYEEAKSAVEEELEK